MLNKFKKQHLLGDYITKDDVCHKHIHHNRSVIHHLGANVYSVWLCLRMYMLIAKAFGRLLVVYTKIVPKSSVYKDRGRVLVSGGLNQTGCAPSVFF